MVRKYFDSLIFRLGKRKRNYFKDQGKLSFRMDEYIKDKLIMGFLKAKADLFKKMEMFYKAFGKREL